MASLQVPVVYLWLAGMGVLVVLVLYSWLSAAAERETSDSSSLADELGRHYFTDEPVPGIAWEYERVKAILPPLTLDAVNTHAVMVLSEPGSQPFVMVAAPTAPGVTDAALRSAASDVSACSATASRACAGGVPGLRLASRRQWREAETSV